jgi:hypothetical protein
MKSSDKAAAGGVAFFLVLMWAMARPWGRSSVVINPLHPRDYPPGQGPWRLSDTQNYPEWFEDNPQACMGVVGPPEGTCKGGGPPGSLALQRWNERLAAQR